MGNGERSYLRSAGTLPTSRRVAYPTGLLQGLQSLAQPLVLDRQIATKLCPCQHGILGKKFEHLLLETVLPIGVNHPDDLQVGCLGIGRDQLQRNRRRSRRCAVLAGEHQTIPGTPQVEVRVAEGVQVAGTAESLTGSRCV